MKAPPYSRMPPDLSTSYIQSVYLFHLKQGYYGELSYEKIAKHTGFTVEEIQKLAAQKGA